MPALGNVRIRLKQILSLRGSYNGMALNGAIPRVSELVFASLRWELVEEGADFAPDRVLASLGGLSQQVFEFDEYLLDQVQIERIGRQEEQFRACRPDGAAYGGGLVAAEVVQVRRIRQCSARADAGSSLAGIAVPTFGVVVACL